MIDKLNKHAIWIAILLHIVGIIGILSPYKTLTLSLTPINLSISCALVILSYPNSKKLLIFCIVCYLFGLLIEMLGVNTGMIFGTYTYGKVLGPKVLNTPLLIGINWLVLILSIGALVQKSKYSLWKKIILSSILMVTLDILIEPIAVTLNFWYWDLGYIPFMNYVAWFLVSMLLFILYFKFELRANRGLSLYFYTIQLLFFGLLNIMI